jgi:uncharacterized membrane protein YvbJ
MYCRSCGASLVDNAVACNKCGLHPMNGVKFCQGCGAETQEHAVMCTSCGISLKSNSSRSMGEISPVIAAVLNLVWPGVGNIYLGQKTKGIVFCVINLIMYILDTVTCGFFAILHVPFIIIMIIDAALIAGRIQKGEPVDEWKFF